MLRENKLGYFVSGKFFFSNECVWPGPTRKKIAREKHSSLIVPSASDEENRRMITLQSGVNVTKKFPSLLMMRPNKLECLYLAINFQSSLTFAGNTRSLPKKEPSGEGPPIWLALALPTNSKTWLERVSKDKQSSLLGLIVSDKGKKFYNVAIRRSFSQQPQLASKVLKRLVDKICPMMVDGRLEETQVFAQVTFFMQHNVWKGSNCKQSARWQQVKS